MKFPTQIPEVPTNILLWCGTSFTVFVVAAALFSKGCAPGGELSPHDFEEQLKAGNVTGLVSAQIMGTNEYQVRAELKTPFKGARRVKFYSNSFPEEWEKMISATDGVVYRFERPSELLSGLIATIPPILLIFGLFWLLVFRQMQGGSHRTLSIGKSQARLVRHTKEMITFDDAAGVDEPKAELRELVDFLRAPKKFTRLGGSVPRGVLLTGPPGSGKTLLARAVAGEAMAPFFYISGSDFVEMFAGVGASRVRDLFIQGRKHAPCVIFIDEIDAVGRQRGAGLGGGHDEREQTLNQLLVEMDGFSSSEGVILMAATNRPDVLDRALLRSGRFDRQIIVTNPDVKGRESILAVHVRNNCVPVGEDVNLARLAQGTTGFSGAELANLVNEAALLATRRGQDAVAMKDFEDAKDRVLIGPERRSMSISDRQKREIAYHEAGHCLVCRMLPDADPVHKVTIIPRGSALGATSMLPTEERFDYSLSFCNARIRVMMGGRAAEDIVFSEFTSGASKDLSRATELAHSMVCDWGMSGLGPIAFGTSSDVFLGRDLTKKPGFSEVTARAIDGEIHRILSDAYREAKDMLSRNLAVLVAVAEGLYERETLVSEELDDLIQKAGGFRFLDA